MTVETILLILIVAAGAYMAWNIGANDVANAMGTSVGSGALTLRQAVIIAAVLEFAGAFFFGSHVSETIQNDIIDSNIFHNPMTLVYGMLAALLAAGLWLQIASYFGWPVSTTHSIVGAIVGFGMAIGGIEAIYWDNVLFIATSWILSPILGAIFSFWIFNLLKMRIFHAHDPVAAAKRNTPTIVFFVFFILSLIMLYKGLNHIGLDLNFAESILISAVCGGIGYLISKWLLHFIRDKFDAAPAEEYAVVEKIFGYLQIISACLMAFAHGANDVANAIGPLSAAIGVLTTGVIATQNQVPTWALALGGVGIVIGLATWGWRVIETIGKKITELTPTRGFSAEFGAAVTILLASRLGMPISTTHTLVGSVIGVGLARGLEALDLRTTRYIFISWLVTVPAGAVMTIILFYFINAIF